ncbi:hypothetical protein, partial [Glaesserella parasuis]|uniref:hypothetical protein n=1 Tax=Glaesserella parasuis TaxID=738 RepID=UPI00054FDA7B
NTETTVSEENSSEITSTDSPASNAETVVLETENTPITPTNGNSSEPSVDNTAQSAVEMPVVVTEEAKPTESVVAENNENRPLHQTLKPQCQKKIAVKSLQQTA